MSVYFHSLNQTEKDFSELIMNHSGDRTVTYKEVDGKPVNYSIFYPQGYCREKRYPVFLMIHGGGWRSHGIFPDQTQWEGDQLGYLARYYANQGYAAISIDYRLMKENGQDENFQLIDLCEDCVDAVIHLVENAEEYSLDFADAILLGESAGGYLAAALATLSCLKCPVSFSKLILVNPITNLLDSRWGERAPKCSTHPILKGKTKLEIAHLLSPAWNVTKQTPKTLLMHGWNDTAVYKGNSQVFYDEMMLQQNDVELHWIDQTEHAFLLVEYMQEKREPLIAASIAIDVMDRWLAKKG